MKVSGARYPRAGAVSQFGVERILCGIVGAVYGCAFGASCSVISPLLSVTTGALAGSGAGFFAGFASGFIGAGPLSGALGLICGALIVSDSVVVSMIGLIFGILPLINSVTDYMSVVVTRVLVGIFVKSKIHNPILDFLMIITLISSDLILSAVFTCLLIFNH